MSVETILEELGALKPAFEIGKVNDERRQKIIKGYENQIKQIEELLSTAKKELAQTSNSSDESLGMISLMTISRIADCPKSIAPDQDHRSKQ